MKQTLKLTLFLTFAVWKRGQQQGLPHCWTDHLTNYSKLKPIMHRRLYLPWVGELYALKMKKALINHTFTMHFFCSDWLILPVSAMVLPNWLLSIRNNLQEIQDIIVIWNPLVWSILTSNISSKICLCIHTCICEELRVEHMYKVGLLNWHTVRSDLSLPLWVVGLNWERTATHSIFISNTDQISNSCWTSQFYLTMEC